MVTIELTEQALKNIENMYRHACEGDVPMWEERVKIRESLLHAFMTIFRWPGTVTAEDDLSLIINSGITIGVIYHKHSNDWGCHS